MAGWAAQWESYVRDGRLGARASERREAGE